MIGPRLQIRVSCDRSSQNKETYEPFREVEEDRREMGGTYSTTEIVQIKMEMCLWILYDCREECYSLLRTWTVGTTWSLSRTGLGSSNKREVLGGKVGWCFVTYKR